MANICEQIVKGSWNIGLSLFKEVISLFLDNWIDQLFYNIFVLKHILNYTALFEQN